MSGAKRIGPRVTVHRSCDGCAHERATYYACQGDTGYHHDCAHPAHGDPRRIGYSSDTPGWCPEITRTLDGWEGARAVMASLGYRMENDPALGVRWLPVSPPPHAHPRDEPAALTYSE